MSGTGKRRLNETTKTTTWSSSSLYAWYWISERSTPCSLSQTTDAVTEGGKPAATSAMRGRRMDSSFKSFSVVSVVNALSASSSFRREVPWIARDSPTGAILL
jgi:hypothetical protein